MIHKVMPNLVQPLKGWRRNPIITQKRKDTTNIYKFDHLDSPYGRKNRPVTSFLSFTQCDITCTKWTLWAKAKITGKYKIIILKSMCKAMKDTGSWETKGYIDNLIVYYVNVLWFPEEDPELKSRTKVVKRPGRCLGLRNCSLRETKLLEFLGSIFRETPTHRKAEGYHSMCSLIDTYLCKFAERNS